MRSERGRAVPRLAVAIAATGGAVAVLVGFDGSAGWQLARVVAVLAGTAILALASTRSGARWRGWAAVSVGIPAVAVAAGFAPHWAKGGPVAVQAAAAVLAVAGLALVIGGTAVATGSSPWWRRTATSLAVVLATATTMLIVGPAVAATNVPRPAVGADPGSVGLDHVDVTLRTRDGVALAAWYVESTNRAAVVLLHGAGSTRSDVLTEARVLADAGFGVLLVDARGHGASGGRAMDFGWHGDADVAAATDFLARRPGVDPARIGAVGISMGGEQAIGATGSNDAIAAVVAEGATARTAADAAWLADAYGLRGFVQEQLEAVQDRVTDVLTSATIPTSLRGAVEGSGTIRYLLITAGDEPDEAAAARHIAAGAPDRVTVWTVPDAGHAHGLATDPDGWAARVVDFLTASLLADLTGGSARLR